MDGTGETTSKAGREKNRERGRHVGAKQEAGLTVDRKSDLLLHGFIQDVDIVNTARDEGAVVFGRRDEG